VGVVRTKIGPAFTSKNFKEVVIRSFVKEDLIWGGIAVDTGGKAINKKTCCFKSRIPVSKGDMRVSKESKASVNNLSVFTFNTTILMMCMGTCFAMRDAMSGQKFL